MDQQPKGQVSSLLEHSWFFGNTLKNKPISAKIMVRSNSDPCPSSTTKEVMTMISPDHDPIKTNNLRRAPSLPVTLEKNRTKYDLVEEDDEDEPRMGDLIMEAMPMPVSKPSRRLDRMSSLPPCRVANEASSNAQNLKNVEKSCKKVSVESSPPLLQEKGPIAMAKLTRRASIDSSLLPPKYTSKGTKQTSSNSKNRTPKKQDATSNMNIPNNSNHKIKSQKSLINVQVDELQGLKDLGFSLDNNDISPNVKQVRPTLQRGASLDSKTLRRSHLSQPPSVLKWNDPKTSSNQDDMKAQIKFWARAVASNVRQEC